MGDRIGSFRVQITEIVREPPLDSGSFEGRLLLEGEPWFFISEEEDISERVEYRVVGEKTEDEMGRYLRIHEVLSQNELVA